jgi:hypothetical protein
MCYGLEKIKMEQIKTITQALKESLCVIPPIETRALESQFYLKEYVRVTRFIKNIMGISCQLSVKCLTHYPKDQPLGKVKLIDPFPRMGTRDYLLTRPEITIRADLLEDFHLFMAVISHEMAHIVLHGMNHPLKISEVATDITALGLGFAREHFLAKRSGEDFWNGGSCFQIGYLRMDQLFYATSLLDIELKP